MTEMPDGTSQGGDAPQLVVPTIGRRRLLRTGAAMLGAAALSPLIGACTSHSATPTPAAATRAAATQAPTALAATATSAATARLAGGGAPTPAPVSERIATVDTYLTILTDAMVGRGDGWPAYAPAFFRVPPQAQITVHVLNFDDATDMSDPSLIQYTEVSGTVDTTVIVQSMANGNPNDLGKAQVLSQLDPKKGVSHTFTIEPLALNVPIAPFGVTTFTIFTGNSELYHWECHVPCGGDPNGLGAAMITPGYMVGTMTVV